jgi:hypothetical protein
MPILRNDHRDTEAQRNGTKKNHDENAKSAKSAKQIFNARNTQTEGFL